MARSRWSALWSRRTPFRRSPAATRPRLLSLEDRLAPATLDVSAAGVLSFSGANVANTLTVSLATGVISFDDPLDPITLGAGAIAAGFTTSGGGATASGPIAGVTGLTIDLGTAANTVVFGTFDAPMPSIAVTSAGVAGSSLSISAMLDSTGSFSAQGFASATIGGALKAPNGILIAVDNLDIQQAISSSAARAVLRPATALRAINLGTEVATALSLTSAELDRITAGVLQVGDIGAAGNITVSAAIAPPDVATLSLASAQAVAGSTLSQITVAALAVQAQSYFSSPANFVGTFAAQTQLDCTFIDAVPLTVGVVDGISGVTSGGGLVTLGADQIAVTSPVSAAGFVTLAPRTSGRAVDLGGPDSATSLGLTDAELDLVTAGVLQVGTTGAGDITVTAAITQPAGYSTLRLTTGGAVATASGGSIAVTNLSVQANLGIDLPGLQTATAAAANLISGDVTLVNAGSLTLQPVAGVDTTRNDGGALTITVAGGLTIVQDILAAGTITLTTTDLAGAGQDILVGLNRLVQAAGAGSNVALRAGDDVLLSVGSTVRAGGAIQIVINFADVDGAGATATTTGALLDAPTGGAAIAGAGTDDTFNVSASPTTVMSVDGGGGFDQLRFDAAGRAVAVGAGVITSAGNPALQPVAFANIELVSILNSAGVTIPGTAGDDTFTLVRGGSGVQVTVNGGPVIVIGEAPLTLDGLGGTNTLVLDFSGGSPIPAGGASFVNISRYIARGTAADDLGILQRVAGVTQFQFNGGAGIDLPGATYFQFDGLAGNDTLRVLYAGGDPVPVNGALFDGGLGDDRLGVLGAGNTATYLPSATAPGSGVVGVDLGTIGFVNLTPVDITGMTTVNVVFPNGDDVVAVDDGFDFTMGGVTPAIRVSGTTGGIPFETLALWNNTNVTIDTTSLDGNDAVTINSATVGNNTNLAITTGAGNDTVAIQAGGVLLAGNFSVTSQAVAVIGGVTSTGGTVTFTNAGTLTIGAVSISAGSAIVQNGSGPVSITGNANLSTPGSIGIAGAVTLAGGVTATFTSTGGGAVTFNSTLNGSGNVVANTAGLTSFLGAIGVIQPLASLTTDAAGTTDLHAGTVIATGSLTFNDPVILTANTTLTGGSVTFAQTVDSNGTPRSLAVNSAGTTTFGGAVGGSSALASLATDAPGSTAINGGLVRTSGAQFFADPVTVGAANTSFLSLGNGSIVFDSTVNGASNVTVTTAGLTIFDGAVGGTTALTSLTTNGGGTTAINGGLVRTTGAQSYADAVSVGAASTLFTSLGNAAITFSGTLDGGSNVTVTTSGLTTFGGAVGGLTPLAGLTTNGAGTTAINGGLVRTNGAQNYLDAVTLGAPATQFISLANGAIVFTGTLTGASNVNIATGGATDFLAAVSLASLTTDAPGTTDLNGGTITTTGDQTYNDPVILTANTTINAANVTFAQTVNSDATPRTLTVNASGVTRFNGVVGGIRPLAALTTDAPGSTQINGGAVTTIGTQTYNDPLGMPVGTTVLTATGAAGDILFNGPTTSLGAVLINNARDVSINNAFTAVGLFQTAGSGATSFNGPTLITGVPAIDVTNTAISLNADVTASGSGATVRFNATVNGVAQAAGTLLAGVGLPPTSPTDPNTGRNGVLLLSGAGSFTLNRPNNDVGLLTANIVGALNVLDSNDLAIATAGIQNGIRTNNGAVTITTGRNFIADDPNILVNPSFALINAGAGIVQVNPGQAFGALIQFNCEVIAGSVTLGTVIVPAQMFNNAQPDQFRVRPSANVEIVVQGNRPSIIVPPLDPSQRDALSPIFAGLTVSPVLTPTGVSQGVYTFPVPGMMGVFERRALRFFEIEQLVGLSATTIAYQTGATTFQVVTQVQQLGTIITSASTSGQPSPNPFVVAPNIVNPFQPFGASRLAYGDVNADGAPDLIIGAGPNSPPLVTVIDGNKLAAGGNLNLNDPSNFLAQFYAYNPSFPGGVFISAGDINGDGFAEIVTGPDVGGGPHVRILSVNAKPGQLGFVPGPTTIYNNVREYTPAPGGLAANFNAYDPSFTGGVRVAVGDVDGDNKADVITGAGPGGGPHVKTFSGATGLTIRSFFAYDPGVVSGIFVGAGRFNNDNQADILTGPGIGSGPHIKVFSGADPTASTLLANFLVPANLAAPPPSLTNPNPFLGVGSVAFSFIDGDNTLDIVVGTSRGTQSRVLFFRADGSQIVTPTAFGIPGIFTDGVNVAGSAM